MSIVSVEYNSKSWAESEEREISIDEIIDIFKTFSIATKCPIRTPPHDALPTAFWYCEYVVEPERVLAFVSIFDWTMDFIATLVEE